MITHEMMYWITRLDNLIIAFTFLIIFSGMGICIRLIFLFLEPDQKSTKTTKKLMIVCIVGFCVSFTGIMFVPSTKDIAAIYLIPKIVNNEQAQKLPANLLSLLNKKLEEWLQDKK